MFLSASRFVGVSVISRRRDSYVAYIVSDISPFTGHKKSELHLASFGLALINELFYGLFVLIDRNGDHGVYCLRSPNHWAFSLARQNLKSWKFRKKARYIYNSILSEVSEDKRDIQCLVH